MGRPTVRLPTRSALLLVLLLAGCGGGSHTQSVTHKQTTTTPARRLYKADPHKVAIVRAWADTLRSGDVAGASRYFAVPVVIQNAGPAYKLNTRASVRLFNASLPCGARVVSAVAGDKYTIVTFRLTERRHSHTGCGSGTGHLAATAFRFRHGRISEWIRVTPPSGDAETGSSTA